MTTTIVTYDTGGTLKPGPTVTVHPEREETDDTLAGFAAGSGLNSSFVADLLSGCLMHERMGVLMYRALRHMTDNPTLQATLAEFGTETETAVAVWEALVIELGGNVQYVSPPARMTESMDAHLLQSLYAAGSADQMTLDLKIVEAVLLSAASCAANAELVGGLAAELPDGDPRLVMENAVARLAPAAAKHGVWARETQRDMVLTPAQYPTVHKVADAAGGASKKAKSKSKAT